MIPYEHYTYLSALFDFPGPEFLERGQSLHGILRENYPEAAVYLQKFLDGMPEQTLNQQELYTRTFDVQAITTLDIGYVLFGDDYKRAVLLSNLAREHHQSGNDCKVELGDHLPNVLRLIPKLKDQELVAELVSEILVPALMLMIREFEPERIEKKNAHYQKHFKTLIAPAPVGDLTIYHLALKTLFSVLTKDWQVEAIIEKLTNWSLLPQTADFLGQIAKEMEIENTANPTNSGCDS